MTQGARILYLEDDANIALLTAERLTEYGYEVVCVTTLAEAVAQTVGQVAQFDLLLLDWNVPDGTGLDFLEQYRRGKLNAPVIFLTARTEMSDLVRALDSGAQDYLTKPFQFKELLARIRVQLRDRAERIVDSNRHADSAALCHKEISLSPDTFEVTFAGVRVNLTKMEFQVLRFFMEQPQKVFSREEFLDRVWGENNYGTNRTVDTHILQLRKKFRAEYFETVWGFGYRLLVFACCCLMSACCCLMSAFAFVVPAFADDLKGKGGWPSTRSNPSNISVSTDISELHNALLTGERYERIRVRLKEALQVLGRSTAERVHLRGVLARLVQDKVYGERRFPDRFLKLDNLQCTESSCGQHDRWAVGIQKTLARNEKKSQESVVLQGSAARFVLNGGAQLANQQTQLGTTLHWRVEEISAPQRPVDNRTQGLIFRIFGGSESSFASADQQPQWLVASRVTATQACFMASAEALRDRDAYTVLLNALDVLDPVFECGVDSQLWL